VESRLTDAVANALHQYRLGPLDDDDALRAGIARRGVSGDGPGAMLRRFTTVAARSVDRGASCLAGARGFASSGASSGWFGGGKGAGVSGDARAGSGTVADLGDSASAALDRVAAASDAASTSAPALADGAFDPVGVAAAALESAHVFSGLPWWATIACGAVGVRLALFPFTLQQAKAGALLNTAIARARGPDGKPPRSLGEILAAAVELRRRTGGVHPAWLVGSPLVQLPTFVIAVLAVRRLAARPDIGLETGGALWFADLTEVAVHVDSVTAPMGVYGAILPIATAGALFANINNSWGKIAETSRPAALLKLAMEWLTVPTLMIGLQIPQAVHCYWLPSSLSALAQGAAMRTDFARRALAVDPRVVGGGGTGGPVGGVGTGEPVPSPFPSPSPSPGTVRFSRPLDEDESRLIREAAEARAEKRAEDAANILERAANVDDPHPTVLFALGQTRAGLKRWRVSAEAYEACAAAELNGEQRARALAGAGVARANAGHLEAAARALEGALAIREGDVSSMLSLAAVRKGTGDVKGAVDVLERAAALVPEVRERYLEPLLRQIDDGREGDGKRGGGRAKGHKGNNKGRRR